MPGSLTGPGGFNGPYSARARRSATAACWASFRPILPPVRSCRTRCPAAQSRIRSRVSASPRPAAAATSVTEAPARSAASSSRPGRYPRDRYSHAPRAPGARRHSAAGTWPGRARPGYIRRPPSDSPRREPPCPGSSGPPGARRRPATGVTRGDLVVGGPVFCGVWHPSLLVFSQSECGSPGRSVAARAGRSTRMHTTRAQRGSMRKIGLPWPEAPGHQLPLIRARRMSRLCSGWPGSSPQRRGGVRGAQDLPAVVRNAATEAVCHGQPATH